MVDNHFELHEFPQNIILRHLYTRTTGKEEQGTDYVIMPCRSQEISFSLSHPPLKFSHALMKST